jgi:hypothetical protein
MGKRKRLRAAPSGPQLQEYLREVAAAEATASAPAAPTAGPTAQEPLRPLRRPLRARQPPTPPQPQPLPQPPSPTAALPADRGLAEAAASSGRGLALGDTPARAVPAAAVAAAGPIPAEVSQDAPAADAFVYDVYVQVRARVSALACTPAWCLSVGAAAAGCAAARLANAFGPTLPYPAGRRAQPGSCWHGGLPRRRPQGRGATRWARRVGCCRAAVG